MKRTVLLVLFCAAALALTSGGGASARAPQKNVAPKNDKRNASQPSPEKPKVTEIKEAGLKSLLEASAARSRPLLINFWATWCVPCREEFPDLVKIRESYPDEQLDFITVSLDEPAEIGTNVPEFLSEMRAGRMPAYLLNAADPEAAINLVDNTWRGELPATFLFDREGKVAFKHMGRVKPAELQTAIEKTLDAKAQAPPAP